MEVPCDTLEAEESWSVLITSRRARSRKGRDTKKKKKEKRPQSSGSGAFVTLASESDPHPHDPIPQTPPALPLCACTPCVDHDQGGRGATRGR